MRQEYILLSDRGEENIVADQVAISGNGDLSFLEKKLVSKEVNAKTVITEIPELICSYARGQWTILKRVEKEENTL